MSKRPIPITVIAWLLIVAGGFFFITDIARLPQVKETVDRSPVFKMQQMYSYLKISFALISGIGILLRQNWARFLYLGYWIISFIIYLVSSKPITTGVIGGSILFLITVYFLFNPTANAYFAGRDLKKGAG